MTMQKYMTGFTLGELAVTVAVATILFAFAIPSMQMMFEHNRLTTQTNAFVAAINLARSEAIRRNTRVTLCKSAEPYTACAPGDGYEQGWIIFVDRNNNATVEVGEEILRVNQRLRGEITILGNTANVANYISFNSSGSSRLIGPAGAFQAGTIEVRVPKVTSWYNAVVLAQGGRVRVEKKP